MRWEEHVTCMGETRNAYKILVEKPEGKRPLKGTRLRCEDNIIMDCIWLRIGTSGGLL
jgi:hypothetical protein